MRKIEHDFLTWSSFPSSMKLLNDEPRKYIYFIPVENLPVPINSKIRVEVASKQTSITSGYGHVTLNYFDEKWIYLKEVINLPTTPFDWTTFKGEAIIPMVPAGSSAIQVFLIGASGVPGITWFDDLKIYQDGVLIYSDDFSKWDPVIGAGIGAPIGGAIGYFLKEPLGPMVSEAVGAVLGGALGGGVGLLTGLGIIPVPQIPTLGATPGESVAPARLGKYLVTG